MPDLSANLLALLVFPLLLGAIIGWLARGSRVKREKYALSVSWQEQMSAQKTEHKRVAEQNRKLKALVGEHRTNREEVDARAGQLAAALLQARQHAESVQSELDNTRAQLDDALKQHDAMKQDVLRSAGQHASRDDALREKDEKIFKLSRELDSWQNRLPPLLEKFSERDLEAQQLQIELDQTRAHLAEARSQLAVITESASRRFDETTVESIDELSLSADLDASNEQYDNPRNDNMPHENVEDEERDDAHNEGQQLQAPPTMNGHSPDDLKQIKGVGPAIEKTLNDLGIYRFDQIAAMDDIEIDRVAQELRGFQSRIYREDWIGQARLLQVERTGPAH